MKILKLLLYKILGLKLYLRLVSKVYIKYIESGFGKQKYKEIHYLKTLIKPDYCCLDIGANLGYYSYFMAKHSGNNGFLYAVEPVTTFCDIWKRNLKKYSQNNIKLFPFALGKNEQKVEMGMPIINNKVHHGMTKIIKDKETNYEKKFVVQMQNPDSLFVDINKIDFIKVDVEGYENQVFENMQQTIKKHKPIIQSELSGYENRKKSINILSKLGYKTYYLNENKLNFADDKIIETYNGDFYFLTDNI